ncbi:hypothetical protein RND81_13G069200 [Saponaria officinalis]|uniref:Uncharacterized protein n=1 Tax=Saponaria officinalis TaxID=3572 RepID=A0AAW1H3B6_SAPOF
MRDVTRIPQRNHTHRRIRIISGTDLITISENELLASICWNCEERGRGSVSDEIVGKVVVVMALAEVRRGKNTVKAAEEAGSEGGGVLIVFFFFLGSVFGRKKVEDSCFPKRSEGRRFQRWD